MWVGGGKDGGGAVIIQTSVSKEVNMVLNIHRNHKVY